MRHSSQYGSCLLSSFIHFPSALVLNSRQSLYLPYFHSFDMPSPFLPQFSYLLLFTSTSFSLLPTTLHTWLQLPPALGLSLNVTSSERLAPSPHLSRSPPCHCHCSLLIYFKACKAVILFEYMLMSFIYCLPFVLDYELQKASDQVCCPCCDVCTVNNCWKYLPLSTWITMILS